jgi:CRISPR-associated protein Cas2
MYIVVSYDISSDEKRLKVAEVLKDYGARVQYSVFECQLEGDILEELLQRLKPFPQKGDSIRVYRLCQSCVRKIAILGKGKIREKPELFVV